MNNFARPTTMRKPLPLLALLLPGTASVSAQQLQHALDFDGVGDQAVVFNASSQLVGAGSFSLTCWVYPRNPNANFPDMEGFAGFRDDATFDFYLLQTYGSALEGRFRNSVNNVFTLTVDDALTIDAWQHLALVYTGTELRMFINGALVASTEAWGTTVSPSRSLHIGNVPFVSFDFWLDGRVDEVGVWRRGLSPQEVACIKDHGADATDPDLRYYFRMDQGVAGGDNTGIASLTNATGGPSAIFSGLSMNGNGSNLMTGAPLAGTTLATICPGEVYVVNGVEYSEAGVFVQMVPLPGGCDSLVVLDLAVLDVEVGVEQEGGTLTAVDAGGPWQWLDCNNGFAPVDGATEQSFTPAVSGSYALAIEADGCTALSDCFLVLGTAVAAATSPMPVAFYEQGILHIDLLEDQGAMDALVLDAAGRTHKAWRLAGGGRQVRSVEGLPAGVYMLRLIGREGARTLRFVHAW